MKLETVNISKLIKNPNNPRFIKDKKFELLKQSITDFPEMLQLREIVTDENYMILGGNMRYEALKDLGYKEVTIKIAEGLTDEQKKEFTIKDNANFGEWDFDELANSWEIEDLTDWGVDLPNWDLNEATESKEDSYEMPESIQTDIVIGDLIEIGEHRLLCGDSTNSDDVAKLMNGLKADMVFTDPMYNDNPNDIIAIFEMIKVEHFLIMATFKQCIGFINNSGYDFRFDLVYNQKVPSSTMNKKVPYYLHKNIVYLTKSKETIFNCDNATGYFSEKGYFPSIIESAKNTSELHGLTKNSDGIKLMLSGFMFKTCLDLFLGSGTTMAACHQLNRKCYGMELEPKYCELIIQRMLKLDNTLIIKRNNIDVTSEYLNKLD